MVIFIPPIAITLLAVAVVLIVLFGLTDWWEIIILAGIISVMIYLVFWAPKRS